MRQVKGDYESLYDTLKGLFENYEILQQPDDMSNVEDRIRWIQQFKNRYMRKAKNDIAFYKILMMQYNNDDAPAAKKQRVRELHNEGLRY